MAIIKKNDVAPERPVIIVLYGTPGSGKTSMATTANQPLLIDTDRGYDRAVQRIDTLTAGKWEDILDALPDMASYRTIIVDTAKACLDDYLADYAVRRNIKLRANTLKRFGQMADDFKQFVNTIRSNSSDIVFICHDKETAEGDIIRHSPDCTGQSKDLLLRIADQVGFISVINGRRHISFEPLDNYVGKNVAQIPATEIPDASTPQSATFMADIIQRVKTSIQSRSEAQRQANELIEHLRNQLQQVDDDTSAATLLTACKELPSVMKAPFFAEIKQQLAIRGFTYKDGRFTMAPREAQPEEGEPAKEENPKRKKEKEDEPQS